MNNKIIKYVVLVVVIGIALYNSVNVKPLDEVKEIQNDLVFDAKAYANDFMSNKIEALTSIDASVFLESISNDLENYCESKGKRLGISDEYNFIIDGNASVKSIEEEYAVVVKNDKELLIATDFIFGNAIRDGSAMADIGDYQNTMDFNSISVELNNIVRETIIPPFKNKVKIGDSLYYKGAVKIDVKKPRIDSIKVIPLSIKFIK